MLEQIKEVIVVEGKDDESAVKKAVDAVVIRTSGFGLSKKTLAQIRQAAKRCGVIVLTDPDFVGEQIRQRISTAIPEVKHAFIPRDEAILDGDIGVENASPESIREALAKVRCLRSSTEKEFTQGDMLANGLIGDDQSSIRRGKLGKTLGIGYGNAKQFLNRLNGYGVTREEFETAVVLLDAAMNKQITEDQGSEKGGAS